MKYTFIKMHGLGNDFVIFDARHQNINFTREQLKHIADRRVGIGCDQIVVLRADHFMSLYNADGSETNACGNATRCVAWLLAQESNVDNIVIRTNAGVLSCDIVGDHLVRVDMGEPVFDWQKIPLAKECDVMDLQITFPSPVGGGLGWGHSRSDSASNAPLPASPLMGKGMALSMGNPHLIFAVPDVETIDLEKSGPELEHHPLFPERVNVSFAQIVIPSVAEGSKDPSTSLRFAQDDKIILKVWERGAGATLACGTAACATVVALSKKGLIARKATVQLPGGELTIEWDAKTNHVFMTGEVAEVFRGKY